MLLTQMGRAEKKLDEINSFVIEQFMQPSRDIHGEIKPIRIRLLWIQKQSQLRALQSDLAKINSRLLNCVAITVLWHQTQIQVTLQEVKLATTHGLSRNYLMQSELSCDNQKDTSTTSSPAEDDATTVPQMGSIESSATMKHCPKWVNPTAIGYCSQACQCTCHSTQRKQTAGLCSLFFGTVCLKFIGGNNFGACNSFGCKRRLPIFLSVGYYFPRWILDRVVQVSIDNSLTGSFRMVLQVPRICSDASTIFHLATAGDIQGMKSLFDRRLASPHDVSASFGYSVLHVCI